MAAAGWIRTEMWLDEAVIRADARLRVDTPVLVVACGGNVWILLGGAEAPFPKDRGTKIRMRSVKSDRVR
jgi:hypothetical protein